MGKVMNIAFNDLKYFFRNRVAVFAMILMPLFMMLMTGYIFPKLQSTGDIKMAFVCHDEAFERFIKDKVKDVIILESIDDAKEWLLRKEIKAVVVIPEGFLKGLLRGENVVLKVIPNPNDPQSSMAVSHSIAGFTLPLSKSRGKVSIKLINPDGSDFKYYDFMAPGIIAMVAIMSVVNGLAAAITRERERGTLDGLLVTPTPASAVIVGKMSAQIFRSLIQSSLILLLAIFLFHISLQGSIFMVYIMLIIGVFSFMGFGIIITSSLSDQESAQMLMGAFTFPMMFLSGVFFPISQMPAFMQKIAKAFPLTYLADALRKIMVLGVSMKSVINDMLTLVVFALVMTGIAIPVFAKATKT